MFLLFCWQDAGGVAAATMVGVPKKPLHLPTNYRTHSGILNAAAAVVDILKDYYPMVSPSSNNWTVRYKGLAGTTNASSCPGIV